MTYSQIPTKHRVDSYRRALTVGLGAQLLVAPALWAQDAAQPASSSEPLELERVLITGSLIPTAEAVTVTPVDTFSATAIQDVGATDALNALRRLSPDFGGSVGQESANGGSGGEAYIQLRYLDVLVLLDGTRLANSAFSNGASVDVNSIPPSMIERIEVLKDGGSVLYGTQAVGGVVNIITKKNFTGVDMGGRWGFGTRDGNYNENLAYVVFGSSTDKAKFTGGIQHYHADEILANDRDWASMGIEELVENGIAPVQTYLSPTISGRAQDPTLFAIEDGKFVPVASSKSYVLAGSPFAKGAEGYNPSVTRPPVFPGVAFPQETASITTPGLPTITKPVGTGAIAQYNAYAKSQLGYEPYIDMATTPIGKFLNSNQYFGRGYGLWSAYSVLNTTDFGPAINNSQDRNQAFANASYELYGKKMELYGQFLFSNTTSQTQLAPAPLIALGNSKITIPGDNSQNPFQTDLGYQAAPDPRVRNRFSESGNRVFENQNDFYHFVGGLRGKFDNDWSYDAFYDYNRNDQLQRTSNAINGAALNMALTPNSDPAQAALGMSALTDGKGVAVPLYDLFSIAGNDPRTINAMSTTLFNSGVSELWQAQGAISGTPFELPGGKLGVAFGGGYMQESLALAVDGLTQVGLVPGLNAQGPTPGGARNNGYGFVEVQIPVTGPEMDLPGLHSFQITAAGRYETFTPGGDQAVPKVGVRWQPLDETVTLRANYSESFVAPTVWQLFGGPAASAEPVPVGQVTTTWISNPLLTPSDAQNWTGGIVWTPKWVKGLTLTCDYYNVTAENSVYRRSATEVYNSLNALGSDSPYAQDFTFVDGTKLATNAPDQVTVDNWGNATLPLLNGATIDTAGFDVSATYARPIENYGTLTFTAGANIVSKYNYQDPVIGGPYDYDGQFTENGVAGGAVGVVPDFRVVSGITWDYKGFTINFNVQYTPEVQDMGTLHPSSGDTENFYTIDHGIWTVDAFYSVNMLAAYTFSSKGGNAWWDGSRLAVGCNNLADRDPSIVVSSSNSNTDASAYDTIGRFIYFEVGKRF